MASPVPSPEPDYAFEDLTPGFSVALGPIPVSREEIVAFAREFDPQPFHLGEEAARDTFVGRLIASGWQTCALGMRLFARDFVLRSTSMGSPGIERVRWLRPVEPGDALSGSLTVDEARPSRSKPDRGLVHMRMEIAAAGKPVMDQVFWVMFGRRGAAADHPPRETSRPLAAVPDAPSPDDPSPDDPSPAASSPSGTSPGAAYLEDLVPGMTADLGAYAFTTERVIAFARAYDPQPFHVDEAAGRRSHFGGLVASGWHTGSACMSRIVARHDADCAAARARGEPVARSGSSPGFRDMRWTRPVYAGDTVRYRSTLLETRPSASRPGWGLVTTRLEGVNAAGEPVFEYTGTAFRERRPA